MAGRLGRGCCSPSGERGLQGVLVLMEGEEVYCGRRSSESIQCGDGLTVHIYKNSNKYFFSEYDGERRNR